MTPGSPAGSGDGASAGIRMLTAPLRSTLAIEATGSPGGRNGAAVAPGDPAGLRPGMAPVDDAPGDVVSPADEPSFDRPAPSPSAELAGRAKRTGSATEATISESPPRTAACRSSRRLGEAAGSDIADDRPSRSAPGGAEARVVAPSRPTARGTSRPPVPPIASAIQPIA